MGSDFSNNDLAKSDSLLEDYTHRIVGQEEHAGRTAYIIHSVPKPGAPVVWGLQELKIREDFILLEETFFDELKVPVKEMTTQAIKPLGGRLFPTVWTMRTLEDEDSFTRLEHIRLDFLDNLPERIFSLSSLRNPGRM
jgi:hypothetical protein